MSCKSVIFAANTAAQTVTAGGVVNFGTVVRRYGSACGISGGNVTATGAGYYDILANITFTASATGTASVQLYKNGTAIPGAVATVATTAAEAYAVTVPAIVRQICGCEGIITATISAAGTVNNAAIVMEKL